MFGVKVLADSISITGSRLTTVEMTYPRFVHSEHLRHRAFSPNVASSRAIPVEKIMQQLIDDPVVPIHFGAAQKGMQAFDEVPDREKELAKIAILELRDRALETARYLLSLGLHKQVVNRYLEPWMWCTVICSGTDRGWRHFDSLRCHEMAEPHIRKIAEMTRSARGESTPIQLAEGGLHLPLFGFPGDEVIVDDDKKMRVSAGRCARVSYLTHLGTRDVRADLELCDGLILNKHMSPTEHVAISTTEKGVGGNFGNGWKQFRKMIPGEFTE